MKQIIAIAFAGTAAALLQSCQPQVDTAKEWAAIDSMATAQLMVLRDSLHQNCMDSVMVHAMAKADSMVAASKKSGWKPAPPKQPAPPVQTKPEPVTDPKKDKMGGTTNTDEKKDKMSGNTESTTDKKKDKMKGTEPPK